jgi:hypothetical protein
VSDHLGMLDELLTWARQNSRRVVALAVAPGLLMLAVDAAISHFAGKDFDNPVQFVPVVYGVVAFVALAIVVWPKTRGPFAWTARILGAAGVLVGITGAVLHLSALFEELKGEYTWPSLEGALSVAPPMFAPLGFAGIGALLFFLPSARLLIRIRIGTHRPSREREPLPVPDPARAKRFG